MGWAMVNECTPGGTVFRLLVVNFPPSVLGATVSFDDGSYDVLLNDCLSPELREKVLQHEMRHIDGGHCYNDVLTVSDMEAIADGIPCSANMKKAAPKGAAS